MAAVLDIEQSAPPPPNSTAIMNFEELFNIELFGPSSSSQSRQGSPSYAASTSPSSTFFSFPPVTPPTTQTDAFDPMITDPNIDPSLYDQFSLPDAGFDDAIGMSATNGSLSDAGTSPASSTPYDFFGSYSGAASISSPDTPPSATFPPEKFDMNAIDPRLAIKPAAVAQKSQPQQHRSRPEEDSDESEDDGEELIKPVKAGGKGKGRKGTVASGGVVKRTSSAVTSALASKDKNDDDWRPSPEEYKKMSSKEKRQLRNKISARNFRVRRKEYITTLEGDIADRDRLIEAIREELGSTKLENDALRQEVDALKRAMLEGRADADLPPPAPLSSLPAATNTKRSTRTSTLSKPNTQKDLPTSPRASASRAFWGGSNAPFGAGGITPVHATLVPEFPGAFAEDHTQQHRQQREQENINPALNLPHFGGFGTTTPSQKLPPSPFQQRDLGANFDVFADMTPFTMKSLDAYRMQLWGRMAREAGQKQRVGGQIPGSSLASAMRPAFFTSPAQKDENLVPKFASPTLAALLSGKSIASSSSSVAAAASYHSSYPTPPSSPPLSRATTTTAAAAADLQPQHALLASLASQTLLSRLGSAFWDAFAKPVPSSSSSSSVPSSSKAAAAGEWDHEKVQRVLEGKAVVRVVDVDDALQNSMKALSLGGASVNASDKEPASASNNASGGVFSRTCAAVIGKK
ncbi:hypothetical protein BU17DRAFT_99241 [Hysterangium stoloniferum]|nr:hypothetical protein BU17DRAFT_99241 [Hysterangium stoloniferum]